MPPPTSNSEGSPSKPSKEYRDQFRRLINAIDVLVVGVNTQGRITFFNRRCEEVTGYALGEVLGKNIIQLLIPEDERPDLMTRFQNLVQRKTPSFSVQVQWITKSGEKRCIRWNNTLIADEEGAVEEVVGIGFDLTELQKEKARLVESNEQYKLLCQNLAEGFLIINPQGVITNCNKAASEILDYSPEEIIGNPIQKYLHPDDSHRVSEIFQQAVRTKTVSSEGLTFKGLYKDGTTVILQIKNSIIMKDGKLDGFQSIIRDITLEKLMEEALQASEEKYRSIVEQSLQGFAILQDQKLIFVNRAIEEMLGYTNEELVTMPFEKVQSIIHPEDAEMVWTRFRDRLKGLPVPQKYDARVIRKDGKTRWVEFYSNRLMYQGKPAIQVLIVDITERKQAESAHQESEAKYRALAEQSLQGIVITKGFPSKIVFSNTAVTKTLGYTPEELLNFTPDRVTELVFPGDRKDILPRIQSLLKTDTLEPLEVRVKHKDGSKKWVHVFGQKIQFAGEPAYQFTFLDITESKLAQIALQESEVQYRTLVETSPDAITLTDLEGKILIANEQTLKIHGFNTVDEIKGVGAFTLVAPEDRNRALENLQKTLTNGSVSNIEYTLLRKDGSRFDAELSAALLRGADGEPRALIGITRDVTERKTVESRLQSLFDHVPVGLFRTTPNGEILDANPALVDILGYEKREEVLERLASDFYVDPKRRDEWERMVSQEGVVRGFEAQFRRADGESIWVKLNARAIRDTEGVVCNYEGSLEDITERKKAEIDILASQRRAEFLVDLMAHDLNNINQGIMLSLEMLEHDDSISGPTQERIKSALAQVERSAELITNVKRFQTIDLEPHRLGSRDLKPPFMAAVQAVERAFPQKKLVLTSNIQDDQYYVTCDGFLTELFFNILHNAMKIDRNEIVKIDVHAEPYNGDTFVKVDIMDRGPGLPDAEKGEILVRYQEGYEGVRGSGIGLTLVQRIIHRYGGKIWVADRVEGDYSQGAKFVVLLPRGDR